MTTRAAIAASLVLLLAMGASMATAQTKPAPSKYAWPRTFSGQPDFEFDKAEVEAEMAKQAQIQGTTAQKIPTLESLLDDEKIDLMQVQKPHNIVAETSSSTQPSVLDKLAGFTMATADLPSLTTAKELNLTEFKTGLKHAIRRAVAAYRFKAGNISLEHVLNSLTLQAVVTSPERYAVINNIQYREGESFPVTVWAGPADATLLDAMAGQLPMEGSMEEDQATRYQEAYEEAVKDLAQTRQTNPHSLQKQVVVPATIVGIQHRKVTLDFNGQRHDLEIRFAY